MTADQYIKGPLDTRTHHLDAGTDEDEYNLFTVTSSINQPLTLFFAYP